MTTTQDVQAYYEGLLRREADPGGLAYWVDQIDNQGATRADLVAALLATSEHEEVRAVIRLYQGIFDRTPDEGGLDFWLGHFRSFLADGQGDFKTDLVDLIDLGNWLESDEFLATYGQTTDEEFITLLYQNVLQRDPDAGGLAYWVNVLSNGGTRERMVVDFTESDEFKDNVNLEASGILYHDAADASSTLNDDFVYDDQSGPWDNGTLFNEAPVSLTGSNLNVDENATTFAPAGILTVADPDGAEDFSWAFSDPSGNFLFVADTRGRAEIWVDFGATIDYETATSHQVTVQVTDRGGHTISEDFIIQVNDVAEAQSSQGFDDFALIA